MTPRVVGPPARGRRRRAGRAPRVRALPAAEPRAAAHLQRLAGAARRRPERSPRPALRLVGLDRAPHARRAGRARRLPARPRGRTLRRRTGRGCAPRWRASTTARPSGSRRRGSTRTTRSGCSCTRISCSRSAAIAPNEPDADAEPSGTGRVAVTRASALAVGVRRRGLRCSTRGVRLSPRTPRSCTLADPGNCVAGRHRGRAGDGAAAHRRRVALQRLAGGAAARRAAARSCASRPSTHRSRCASSLDGWPDTDRPRPARRSRGCRDRRCGASCSNARLADRHRPPMAPERHAVRAHAARRRDARADGAGARLPAAGRSAGATSSSWRANPRGWGAYGHPEWGPFRLGKGNPNWSTTGLDQTIALDAVAGARRGARVARTVGRVLRRFDATSTSTTGSGSRRSRPTSALPYLSAVDHRRALRRRVRHAATSRSDESLDAARRRGRRFPLVAIYPSDATIESDNPIIVLRRAVVVAGGAGRRPRCSRRFALATHDPDEGRGRGLPARAGRGPHRSARRRRTASTSPPAPHSVAPVVAGRRSSSALAHWQANRRPRARARPVRRLRFDGRSRRPDEPARPDEAGASPRPR